MGSDTGDDLEPLRREVERKQDEPGRVRRGTRVEGEGSSSGVGGQRADVHGEGNPLWVSAAAIAFSTVEA